MDTPVTRFIADAASPSPILLKDAAEIPSIILGAMRLDVSKADSVFCILFTDILTAVILSVTGLKRTSPIVVTSPSVTTTSVKFKSA